MKVFVDVMKNLYKVLLDIGLTEGNRLGRSWQFVLHCISQLERLQVLVSRAWQDFQFFTTQATCPAALRARLRATSQRTTCRLSAGLSALASRPSYP